MDRQPPSRVQVEQLENEIPGFIAHFFREDEAALQSPGIFVTVSALKACSSTRDLEAGKLIHAASIRDGSHTDVFVASTAISMFSRCGSLPEARLVFNSILDCCYATAVPWNALMLGYTDSGQGELALDLFSKMESEYSLPPDPGTFVAALKACTSVAAKEDEHPILKVVVKFRSLERGMEIHSRAVTSGCEFLGFVMNSLVDMYSKCGSLLDARMVFDRMAWRTVVSWNSLILGYAERGEEELAVELFWSMEAQGFSPDDRSFMAVLKACTKLAEKDTGQEIHSRLVKVKCLGCGMALHLKATRSGFDGNLFVASSLVDMYSKCGSMLDARRVFDAFAQHDVVLWTALMLGYVENGDERLALEIFDYLQGQEAYSIANSLTFVAALKASIGLASREPDQELDGRIVKLESLSRGKRIHSQAVSCRCDSDIMVANTLVDMYAKCGSLVDARRVFDCMPCRTVVSWNVLLLGYAENNEGELGLDLFSRMMAGSDDRIAPDSRSFVAALKACTLVAVKEEGQKVDGKLVKVKAMEAGMAIHSQARLDTDVFVASTLVDMYAKCGSLVDSRRAFDKIPAQARDVVLWTSLILGYSENDEPQLTLELFSQLRHFQILPNARTFMAALKACTKLAALEQGSEVKIDAGKVAVVKLKALEIGHDIHAQATRSMSESELFVFNLTIDMYSNCGSMDDARRVFDTMAARDMVSWTALILGYTENSQPQLSLELFSSLKLQANEWFPNARAYVTALKSCSSVLDVELGRQIHGELSRFGLESDPVATNSLVDLYGKAGRILNAQLLFDVSSSSSIITWNALVTGYGRQGDVERVLDLYQRMTSSEGPNPDGITMVCVLAACSHGGNVSLGKKYFQAMLDSPVTPSIEHYHCMIDLLGRANELGAALEMITSMPFRPSAITWMTVLGACQKWSNAPVGRLVLDALLGMEDIGDKEDTALLLMINIYAAAGMREELRELEEIRDRRKQGS
ncbi:pentatricopeptide repeat-containing protein At4g39530-like [Selaginella moellendorffii]|uniref:pentatricopeptide repeat-containing protein At4g39530-like n=1 Tax=Selaginella moellendorffii TaxID=88036 RepID=UPI000D1CEF6C|nr:pentatricopeptide repeat-containing protein At4g39530-like [Selaginella moellendorffii]|eukprot:XP_024536100.1 pentatricopeptide repeat-containing protein At4g39530-like [Selaginella moellendorffii]